MADRNTGRPWTSHEDELLSQAVASYGEASDWKTIALHVPGRTNKACRKRWLHSLSPSIKKSAWTREEDETLISLHAIHGTKWSLIARHIPGRTDDACSKRYREALDPSLKRDEWTPEEDHKLLEIYERIGGKWGQVGQEMQRSGLGCRNRWRLLGRKRAAEAQSHTSSQLAPYPPPNPEPPPNITAETQQSTWMDFQSLQTPYWHDPLPPLGNDMPDLQSHLTHSPPSMTLSANVLGSIADGDAVNSQDIPTFCYSSSSSLTAALLAPRPPNVSNPSGFQLPVNSSPVLQESSAIQESPASVHTNLVASPRALEPNTQIDPTEHQSNHNERTMNSTSDILYGEEDPRIMTEAEALPHSPEAVVSEETVEPIPSGARLPSTSRSVTPQREASLRADTEQYGALPAPSGHSSTSYYRSPNSPRRVVSSVQRRFGRQGPPPRLSSNLAASDDPSILAYSCGYPQCLDDVGHESRSQFPTSRELSEHIRSDHQDGGDSNVKPFRCGLVGCGKGWKSVNGLQYHLQVSKAHFREAITTLASEKLLARDSETLASSGVGLPREATRKQAKRFACPHLGCIQVYKQLGGLKYHLRNGHPEQLPAQLDTVPPVLKRKVDEKIQKQVTGT